MQTSNISKKFNCNQIQEFQFFFKVALHFSYIQSQKFLIFQNNIYCNNFNFVKLPKSITIEKINNIYSLKNFSSQKNQRELFLNLQTSLIRLLQNYNKKFKKQIIIKGLGLRIRSIPELNVLELKLGFSNLLYISIPRTIKIFKNKNLISIEGFDPVLVGNFSFLIRSLRCPDSYQGKGLWYKNEIKKLKPVKKV